MGSLLQSLSKDKPLYSLTVGEFQTLMEELVPSAVVAQSLTIPDEQVPENLSISEAAKYLKCSKVTIHKYKKRGMFKFYGTGKLTYFKKHEIDEALSSQPKKKGASK